MNFANSKFDSSLFLTSCSTLLILVYIDDILITVGDSQMIFSHFSTSFSIFLKDLNDLYFFLRLEVSIWLLLKDELYVIDINNTFPNRYLVEKVYMPLVIKWHLK